MRPLSNFERYFYYKTTNKFYSNVRVLAEYDNVERTPLCNALRLMFEKFPVLSMSVSSTEPIATIVNEVLFDDIVEFVEFKNESIETMLNKYHEEYFEFDENNITWKLKVINNRYILLLCDHLFFDGTSAKNFHIELCKCMGNSSGDFNPVLFKKSSLSKVVPSLDDFIDHKPPKDYTAPKLESPYNDLMTNEILTYKECQNGVDKPSDCKIITLSNEKMTQLLTLCRNHNVKLTALLVLIVHISLKDFLSTGDTKTSIPVDLRRQINNTSHPEFTNFQMGLYVSAISVKLPNITKINPDPKELNWKCVEYINKFIHTNAPFAHYELSLFDDIDVEKFTIDKFTTMDKASLEISNLGNVTEPRIKAMWFDQPCDTFSVNVASTWRQTSLVLRCCRQDWIDTWKDTLESLLQKL